MLLHTIIHTSISITSHYSYILFWHTVNTSHKLQTSVCFCVFRVFLHTSNVNFVYSCTYCLYFMHFIHRLTFIVMYLMSNINVLRLIYRLYIAINAHFPIIRFFRRFKRIFQKTVTSHILPCNHVICAHFSLPDQHFS